MEERNYQFSIISQRACQSNFGILIVTFGVMDLILLLILCLLQSLKAKMRNVLYIKVQEGKKGQDSFAGRCLKGA